MVNGVVDVFGSTRNHSVREQLRTRIESDEFARDGRIPDEETLAAEMGTDVETIRRAVAILVGEGVLRRTGGGAYAVNTKAERELDTLEGFTRTMKSINRQPSTRIIEKYTRLAGPKYGSIFGITPQDEIFYFKRLCLSDGEPVSLEETFVPKAVFPKIEGIDLSVFSVYEVYDMYQVELDRADQTLDITSLGRTDSRLLGIREGEPVLFFQSTTYDVNDRVVEFNRNYVRGDMCTYSAHFNEEGM